MIFRSDVVMLYPLENEKNEKMKKNEKSPPIKCIFIVVSIQMKPRKDFPFSYQMHIYSCQYTNFDEHENMLNYYISCIICVLSTK